MAFPFADFRVGQAPDDRYALGGADQIQPEAPEEPGVGSAVAVAGVPGEIRPLDGLPRLAAGQRGGVQQAEILSPCGMSRARAVITAKISLD